MPQTGKLCVDQTFEFGLVTEIIGDFPANGMVGLAPSDAKTSFVNALYKQGAIARRIVGLNYENPLDNNKQSKISFGAVDPIAMAGGPEGLRYYDNDAKYYVDHYIADTTWGLDI